MRIQLSGQMPPEATNGLTPHGKEFLDTPLRLVPVLAMVAVSKKIEKTETGEQYAVVRLHHVEVVPEKHRLAFSDMLGDALADRTGQAMLPFEIDAEVPMKESDEFPEEDEAPEPVPIDRPRRSGSRRPRRAAAQIEELDARSDQERAADDGAE
jgi:hypothetical protein